VLKFLCSCDWFDLLHFCSSCRSLTVFFRVSAADLVYAVEDLRTVVCAVFLLLLLQSVLLGSPRSKGSSFPYSSCVLMVIYSSHPQGVW
jgi:hypothetical protein